MPVTDEQVLESSASAGTQFDGWDEKGTPIVTKKPDAKPVESSATAEPAKEVHSEPEGKSAAESEAAKSQEKNVRKPGDKKSAEERIAELKAEIKTLRGDLERSKSERSTQTAKEPEKKSEPATYAEWRKAFKPREWIEKWTKDNPDASYEDAVAALADHQSDIRDRYRQIEQIQQQVRERAQQQLKKTLEKYPDAEPKVREAAKALNGAGLPFLAAFVDESDYMTDLLFTLSDSATLDNLIETAKSKPGKALRVLRDMELEIERAIAKPVEKKPAAETKEAPAETKPRAPKPPTEVGGRGTASANEEEEAARSGDMRRLDAAMKARYFGARG